MSCSVQNQKQIIIFSTEIKTIYQKNNSTRRKEINLDKILETFSTGIYFMEAN